MIVGRMIGSRKMKARPVVSWARIGSLVGTTGGSVALTRDRNRADPTYEIASTKIAIGAVRNWISAPPIDGPATPASERLPLNSALAERYSSRSAIVTKRVFQEISNTTAREPTTNVTRKSCGRLRLPIM